MSESENSKKPGQLGPWWAIATGLILLATATALIVYVICSLKSGEIGFGGRHNYEALIDRVKRPDRFWWSAIYFTGLSLMLIYFAIPILREGFRGVGDKSTAARLNESSES